MVTGMAEGSRGSGRSRGIYLTGLVKLAAGNMTGELFIRATGERERERKVEIHDCPHPGGYGTAVGW